MATTFKAASMQRLIKQLNTAFGASAGHDHDGTDSKAVAVGTPSAGSIAATAGGRAMMADDYFNAATVLAKFDADCINNANADLIFAAAAFAADADSRAIFADGIWTRAKLAASANYAIFNYQQAALTAGSDVTAVPIFVCPANFTATLVSAHIVPLGSSTGIDDSNKSTWLLTDGSNTIVTKDFDANPAFPDSGVVTDLGALDGTHKILAAGEKLTLSITNGTTAATPATMIQVVYALADA